MKQKKYLKNIKLNQCNPKNKKLVLVNDECYNIFENNYTHGGYICGDNGRWSKKCVPSYCDPGYIFNYTSNKCESKYYYIPDIIKKTKIKTNLRKSFNFLIIFIFLLFLCLTLICYKCKKNKNKIKNEKKDEEELISFDDNYFKK